MEVTDSRAYEGESVAQGSIEAYRSALHRMWPESPEPRLRKARRGGGRSSGVRVSFYVLPNSASPRLLVPANNPTAAARSMQRFSAALSAPDTAKRLAVSALLRSRASAAFPHRMEVQASDGSFQGWLEELFGEQVDFS